MFGSKIYETVKHTEKHTEVLKIGGRKKLHALFIQILLFIIKWNTKSKTHKNEFTNFQTSILRVCRGLFLQAKNLTFLKKNALMHFFGIRFIMSFGPKKFLAAPKEITSDPFYGH